MRFRWPVPRRDPRGNSGAVLTAAMLTAFGAAAMSGPLSPLYRVGRSASPLRIATLNEVVTFVTPPPAPALPFRRSVDHPVIRRPPALPVHRGLRALGVDSLPPTPTSHRPAVAASQDNSSDIRATAETQPSLGTAADGGSASRSSASLVFLRPSRFARSSALTSVQRDSVLYQLSHAVPRLAATRRPTQAERDSLWRSEARRQAAWREQGRPIPIIVGSGGLSLPLFSLGPSREERARDSVVHHDNLLRLARIAERGRAKRDTTRGVAVHPGAEKVAVP